MSSWATCLPARSDLSFLLPKNDDMSDMKNHEPTMNRGSHYKRVKFNANVDLGCLLQWYQGLGDDFEKFYCRTCEINVHNSISLHVAFSPNRLRIYYLSFLQGVQPRHFQTCTNITNTLLVLFIKTITVDSQRV
jgi:hypothetical protein